MRTFLKILALLLTIVVVVLIPLAIFSNQVGQNLFDPSTLLNLAAEKVIGPGLTIDIISDAIEKAPTALGLPADSILNPVFQFASEQYDFYLLLFPQDIQISYAAQLFENFFLWYRGADPVPYLILDMSPLQNHISQNSPQIINSVIQMLPACSAEDTLALAGSLLGGLLSGEAELETMPACIPPVVPVETIIPAVETLLQQQVANIPQTIIIEDLFAGTSDKLMELKSRLQLLEGLLLWGWIPIVFLLLAASYIGGQSLDGFIRWLGWTLLASAIATFLFIFLPVSWWVAMVNVTISSWPSAVQRPVTAMLFGLFELSLEPLPWFALAMFVGGIIFVVIGYFFRSRNKKTLAL